MEIKHAGVIVEHKDGSLEFVAANRLTPEDPRFQEFTSRESGHDPQVVDEVLSRQAKRARGETA